MGNHLWDPEIFNDVIFGNNPGDNPNKTKCVGFDAVDGWVILYRYYKILHN